MKRAITIISAVAAVFLLAVCAVIVAVSDREAPEIYVQAMDMKYSEGDDTSLLVQGVSAYDTRDGEVTDSILVKDVVPLSNGTQAKIVYVARDSANNISEGYRIVSYEKAEESDGQMLVSVDDLYSDLGNESVEVQEEELTEDISETANPEEAPAQTEPEVKEPEPDPEPAPEPEQPKKEDRKKDTKPADTKPADNNKDPKLSLKQSSITLKPGQAIDPMSLIKSKTNVSNVTVTGDVNLSIPGTYNMVYTATGTNGKTTTASLKIVVAE